MRYMVLSTTRVAVNARTWKRRRFFNLGLIIGSEYQNTNCIVGWVAVANQTVIILQRVWPVT